MLLIAENEINKNEIIPSNFKIFATQHFAVFFKRRSRSTQKYKLTLKNDINIKNKRAYFDYNLLDKYVAGIALLGTEIKAIRQGKANMTDAFCMFIGGILYVRNLHVSEYTHSSFYHHDIKRDRALLLQKKEIRKLRLKGEEKGYTIVPLRIFINERGFAKMEIALAQGKKEFDKRDSIKDRDTKRELDRALKR